jgi:hypothetical protein
LDDTFPQTIRPSASLESTSTRRQVDHAAAEEFLALYEGENPGAGPIRSRGTNDPRDPTALHSTDGRFASFTLPSSSGFIYKWTAP